MTTNKLTSERLNVLVKHYEEQLLWATRGMINPRRAARLEGESLEQLSLLRELQEYRKAPGVLSLDAFLAFVNEKASETKSSKCFRRWAEGVNSVAEVFKVARSGK